MRAHYPWAGFLSRRRSEGTGISVFRAASRGGDPHKLRLSTPYYLHKKGILTASWIGSTSTSGRRGWLDFRNEGCANHPRSLIIPSPHLYLVPPSRRPTRAPFVNGKPSTIMAKRHRAYEARVTAGIAQRFQVTTA